MNSSGGFVGETSTICGSVAGSGAGSKSAPAAGLCFFLGFLPQVLFVIFMRSLYSGQWSISPGGKLVLPEAAAELDQAAAELDQSANWCVQSDQLELVSCGPQL